MTIFLAIIWTYATSWLFSALLHVVDADVGSIAGLAEPAVLLSVSVVALLFTAIAWLAVLAHRRGGWKRFLVVVGGLAAMAGVFVAGLGSGAPGTGTMAVALAALFGLAITLAASVPIWIGRRAG